MLFLPDQHKMNSKQQYSIMHIPLYMTPIYNSTMPKQYSTIPKQYSTYTVTIASFSCPPREATPAARDPHFPPGIPFKLVGNIYLIIYMSMKQRFWRATAQYGTADIFFMRSSTSFRHRQPSAPTTYIYIYLCGDIYIIGTSRNGKF